MAAERNEHLVVIMLGDIPTGEEFETWPPHITIVPWFPCRDAVRLDQVLTKIAQKHQKMDVRAGEIEGWGREDKFKVLKIDDDGRLHRLHWEVFRDLEKNGFPIHQKDYLGERYTPHVTLRSSKSDENLFETGEIIKLSNFTLIKQLRLKGSGRMIKSAVKNYELG